MPIRDTRTRILAAGRLVCVLLKENRHSECEVGFSPVIRIGTMLAGEFHNKLGT
jgi:hypothetical protein